MKTSGLHASRFRFGRFFSEFHPTSYFDHQFFIKPEKLKRQFIVIFRTNSMMLDFNKNSKKIVWETLVFKKSCWFFKKPRELFKKTNSLFFKIKLNSKYIMLEIITYLYCWFFKKNLYCYFEIVGFFKKPTTNFYQSLVFYKKPKKLNRNFFIIF